MRSSPFRRFREFLAVTAITVLVTGAGIEILLRFFPGHFPVSLAMKLPEVPRRHVLVHHGLKSASLMKSDGMLYSFQQESAPLHEFKIDADGYRNPDVPRESVDVVLLGDSLLIAEAVENDLGELIRERGLSAYNLGMGGYGLMQYRDAYAKYVTERGLNHSCVVVMVCSANDFSDTDNYLKALESGKPYLDYMDKPPPTTGGNPSIWTLALIENWIRDFWTRPSEALPAEETLAVKLPYESFEAPLSLFHHLNTMPVYPVSVRFGVTSLFEIVEHAPKVAVVLMPSWGAIYSPFVAGRDDRKILFDMSYEMYVQSLSNNFAENPKVVVLDARSALIEATKKERVTVFPEDYHMNQRGTETVAELLAPFLKTCGGEAP
jgi:hypothetical protein